MANPLKLWINAETGRLLSNGSSFISAPSPNFFVGDTLPLELHLIAGAGVARTPYEIPFPAGSAVQVAVGTVAKNPLGGQWRLSVDSTETSDLAFNASASAVQTALNALSAVSTEGGVVVAALGGGYSITWNTVGAKPSILAGSDTLTPSSYESILVLQTGDVSTREIIFVELRQTPLALANSFSPISTPSVSASTVSAWNTVNKVVRTTLTNSPKSGFWTLTMVNGALTHIAAVQVNASANEVRSAITTALAGTTDEGQIGTVTQIDIGQYDIVFTRDFTVSVDGTGLVASDAVVGDISFATSELIAFLGNLASSTASLEISTTAGGLQTTLVQVGCTVSNAVIASGALGPVPVGTLLTETVANARFIRKDIVDAPSTTTQDILWQNLGVTTDGSDTVAAINGAEGASAGNEFLTASAGSARFAPIGSNPFDQSLNTSDSVQFNSIFTTVGGLGTVSTGLNITANGAKVQVSDPSASKVTQYAGIGITFQDATFQDSAFIPADYLSVTDAASTYATITSLGSYLTTASAASTYLTISTASSTYALQSSFDQSLKIADGVQFGGGGFYVGDGVLSTSVGLGNGWTLGIQGSGSDTTLSWNGLTIAGTTGITFADATVQNTRVVREQQANASGYTSGGFLTHYPDEIKVIDNTGTAYWVPARLA